uniref:PHD finger family protein n=3 Tax=Rhizophora mucronata TaxID=61149 RepID=A0A2P2K1H9_RHIMU
MAVGGERPLKRPRRKRVTADLHDFRTFPAAGESDSGQPFRESVKIFLNRQARVMYPPSVLQSLTAWQMVFQVGDPVGDLSDLSPLVVPMDVVEEDVTRSSRSVYCTQCRVVGWSGHPVCRKRYHFIIRADGCSVSGYQKACTRCGNLLYLSESRCKWCDSATPMEDFEEWVYAQFEDHTHLLHGVVHSNGYGHLLTVNGREGGSKVLTGSDIMDFWDRLCKRLAVRSITVMDMSRKYEMEYRLLHAITKGHSWYANWGYEFGCGSYALTLDAYQKAVHTLSTVPLAPLLLQGRGLRTRLQAVIAFYQSLSDSELLNIKDLFSFLLRLIHESSTPTLTKATENDLKSGASKVLCACTQNDVERVQQAMIKVLLAASHKTNWVTRYALKGAMCKTASPELLNYCLKHLGGKFAASGMVVQTRWNHDSYDVEFRLVQLSFTSYEDGMCSSIPSREHVKSDLKFLFDSLLHPGTMINLRPQVTRESMLDAATKLLDCKQFMKDYRPEKTIVSNSSGLRLLCYVELSDQLREDPAIPPELIILPSNATIADLKIEATKTFQEVYAMFKRFEASELLEYGSLEDSITLKFLVGPSGTVRIKGICPKMYALSHFRMERGTERWTVDCICGAKDDDGERMLACDNCGVWHHTRCAGIDDFNVITTKFVCLTCQKLSCKKSGTIHNSKEDFDGSSLLRTSTCSGEVVETDRVVPKLKVTFSVG